uniref:Uncharacterized protein n=1 Tax=Anopheles atroparvus TaxID=41427 RepID=A0AAG5D6J7_ANOAO
MERVCSWKIFVSAIFLVLTVSVQLVQAEITPLFYPEHPLFQPQLQNRQRRQLYPEFGAFPNFFGQRGFGQRDFGQGGGFSGAAASANAVAQGAGGDGGFSGSNAAANSLSQNFGGFGFSSSNANANAFGQGFGPGGFGSSAANAQAQSFQSDGPFGSFGASASNAASQGFSAGPGGLGGSAGISGSQTYKLPGNRQISLAYSNGFSLANGNPSLSNGFSVTQS